MTTLLEIYRIGLYWTLGMFIGEMAFVIHRMIMADRGTIYLSTGRYRFLRRRALVAISGIAATVLLAAVTLH